MLFRSVRNNTYFSQEIDKLDKWGEDKRNSLKVTLKELEFNIKELKKQSRIAPNLPDKLKFEKEIKKLDAERDTAWREYDGAAKDIELNKDKLIDGVEKQLNQLVIEDELFLINWKLV